MVLFTGCSLNSVFFQEFSKVCHLSLASTRLLLVVQKITRQSDCTLAFRCEKNTIFAEHPVADRLSLILKAPAS